MPKKYFAIGRDTEATVGVERSTGEAGVEVLVHLDGAKPERHRAFVGPHSVCIDGRVFRLQREGEQILVLSGRQRHTVTILDRPQVPLPNSLARRRAQHRILTAPLPGQIAAVLVKPGDRVRPGERLVVIEAMKMQNPVLSERDARVSAVHVSVGQAVQAGAKLLELDV